MREYSSRYWVTFKQARRAGGHVKKGEKATPVVYWHWRTPEEMAKLQAEGKTVAPAPCYPFIAWVFNLDQRRAACPAYRGANFQCLPEARACRRRSQTAPSGASRPVPRSRRLAGSGMAVPAGVR